MLDYTMAAKDKIIEDVRRIEYAFAVVPQIVYIAYLIYAILVPMGSLPVNVVLLAISSLYFVFYLISRGRWKQYLKKARPVVRRSYKWMKLAITAYTVGATVYGIYVANAGATHTAAILATVTASCWILQAVIEVVRFFVETEIELLTTAFKTDMEAIVKPAKDVGNFIKRVTGGEVSEQPAEKTTHARRVLDRRVERIREERAERNEKRRERFRQKIESIVDHIARDRGESENAEETAKTEKDHSDPIDLQS